MAKRFTRRHVLTAAAVAGRGLSQVLYSGLAKWVCWPVGPVPRCFCPCQQGGNPNRYCHSYAQQYVARTNCAKRHTHADSLQHEYSRWSYGDLYAIYCTQHNGHPKADRDCDCYSHSGSNQYRNDDAISCPYNSAIRQATGSACL